MSKWIVSIVLGAALLFAGYKIYEWIYTYPDKINVTLTGVKYQLGTEGENAGTEPATIVIKGKVHRNFWDERSTQGERTFEGEVTVVGEQIPVPEDQRKLEIHFTDDGWGAMTYPVTEYKDNGAVSSISFYHSHSIFANKDFSEVTLLVATPDRDAEKKEQADGSSDEKASSGSSWSAEYSYMISAPAANREEALALSNELMTEFLNQPGRETFTLK